MMRVLVACEFSGIVRDAFIEAGHDAISCDLLPSEKPGPHIQGDVLEVINAAFDLMVAFPPCTYLCASGQRWWPQQGEEQSKAFQFVQQLWEAPIERIAIENPVGYLNSHWRKPDQIVNPWWFGHGETKATCLWLKNLPGLMATCVHYGREGRVHHEAPSPERWKNRSRTMEGLALAMAKQWP